MKPARELPVDLTTQAPAGTIEVEDVCAVDPTLQTGSIGANSADAAPSPPGSACTDDSIEIELTPAQIDALLGEIETGR